MTTYTVFHADDSSNFTSGLTFAGAMDRVMSYGDYDWEIRDVGTAEEPYFRLYRSPFSNSSTLGGRDLVPLAMCSAASDRAAAEHAIFTEASSHDWKLDVMTDDDFQQMVAPALADDDDEI